MKIACFLTVSGIMVAAINFSCKSGPDNKHSLVKKWETDTVFKVPESVLVDNENNVLYVSNIDGKDTWAADGKGSISKMGTDGKNIIVDWVTGLNAPKGMGIYNGKLYVADPLEVVVINMETATIEKKIPAPGAVGLNDITIGKDGIVYISDSEGKKIYRMQNDSIALYYDKLKQPNGVLATVDDFYVLDFGGLYKMNADKSLTKIAEGMEGGVDGVEKITGNDFIVSTWDGVVYYVYADGTKEELLDTRSTMKKMGDIGVDPANKTVFVPGFWKNTVIAYEVK